MKIGIFVHSQSGNTSKLALAVTHALREKGHTVSVELLRPVGKIRPRLKKVTLRTLPEIDEYDIVLLGCPIWGFSMSPVVTSFVKQQQSFKDKKVMCFTTSGFPDPLSGAKNAHAAIKSRLEDCGASVIEGTRLWWGFYCCKKTLDKTVAEICSKIG